MTKKLKNPFYTLFIYFIKYYYFIYINNLTVVISINTTCIKLSEIPFFIDFLTCRKLVEIYSKLVH